MPPEDALTNSNTIRDGTMRGGPRCDWCNIDVNARARALVGLSVDKEPT
jgi:hypothetical protein